MPLIFAGQPPSSLEAKHVKQRVFDTWKGSRLASLLFICPQKELCWDWKCLSTLNIIDWWCLTRCIAHESKNAGLSIQPASGCTVPVSWFRIYCTRRNIDSHDCPELRHHYSLMMNFICTEAFEQRVSLPDGSPVKTNQHYFFSATALCDSFPH